VSFVYSEPDYSALSCPEGEIALELHERMEKLNHESKKYNIFYPRGIPCAGSHCPKQAVMGFYFCCQRCRDNYCHYGVY